MNTNDPEHDALKAALDAIELTNTIVSLTDSIKVGLESRGWAGTTASHAATTLSNTILLLGGRK